MAESLSLPMLPVELVQEISAHLAPFEAASLGLTCRTLYYQATRKKLWADLRATTESGTCTKPSRHVALDEEQRWLLLKLLEKDLIDYELCCFCRILHRRSETKSSDAPKGTCIWAESSGLRWWNLGRLTFPAAHRIMEQFRLGEEPGAVVRSLEISTAWSRHPNYREKGPQHRRFRATYVKLDVEGTVFNGELFLHVTQRVWLPITWRINTNSFFKRWVAYKECEFQTCRHDASWEQYHQIANMEGNPAWTPYYWKNRSATTWHPPRRAAIVGLLAGYGRNRLERITREKHLEIPCWFCPMRKRMQTYFHGWKGAEAVLDVCYVVGKCESPDDPPWSLCWPTPCRAGTGMHKQPCSVPEFDENPIASNRAAYVLWKQGRASPPTWKELKFSNGFGESAMTHPSAQEILKRQQELWWRKPFHGLTKIGKWMSRGFKEDKNAVA